MKRGWNFLVEDIPRQTPFCHVVWVYDVAGFFDFLFKFGRSDVEDIVATALEEAIEQRAVVGTKGQTGMDSGVGSNGGDCSNYFALAHPIVSFVVFRT